MSDPLAASLAGLAPVAVCLAVSMVILTVVPKWRERRRQRQNRIAAWQATAQERVKLVYRDGSLAKERDSPHRGMGEG